MDICLLCNCQHGTKDMITEIYPRKTMKYQRRARGAEEDEEEKEQESGMIQDR